MPPYDPSIISPTLDRSHSKINLIMKKHTLHLRIPAHIYYDTPYQENKPKHEETSPKMNQNQDTNTSILSNLLM